VGSRRCRLLGALLLIPAWAGLQAAELPAGAEPPRQVHWAVGAFFGTGWYRVDENRSVYILRIPPRQTLRTAALEEDGTRRLGVEIHYPLSLGLNKLEDVPDFIEFDNYGTISFTPGIEAEVPINPRWSLRPYAHLGYGWESETQDGAWIWYGGIKSRYRLGQGRFQWSLLNGLYYAGYKPQFDNRGQYGSFMTGVEFSQPLGTLMLDGDPLYFNGHLTYNWFFDRLNFHVDEERVESFRDQWEVGIAVGKRGRPINVWFMSFEHIGLAYRFSSDANFNAITVNFRSPFTE
jgi:hypothetical protein